MAVLLGAIKATKINVYYNSYSDAVSAVYDYVSEKYMIDGNDWFSKVSIGGKPKSETTKKSNNITLYSRETGKELKKSLNIQVYRTKGDRYELNFYIN